MPDRRLSLVLAAACLLALTACAPPPHGPMDRGPMPKHSEPQQEQNQTAKAPVQEESATVPVHNSNGSWTPVILTRVGPGVWRGPKGETYAGIPTEEQLRPNYGLK